jgi:hypothetical protein
MVVFLAVVSFTYLSITRPIVDGNEGSRIGLTYSIVERGELNIDGLVAEGSTPDWAHHAGHFYSNKAPGPALLAVPLYLVQNRAQRAMGIVDHNPRARWVAKYIANFATSIVPTLLAMPLLFEVLARRLGYSPGWAFALCGAWAVGSMALPYSVMYFGHQSAGAFFTIGMSLTALELDREAAPRPHVIALAGLAMGLAVISDYLTGALVAVGTVYVASRARLAPRVLGAWAVGGVGPWRWPWCITRSVLVRPSPRPTACRFSTHSSLPSPYGSCPAWIGSSTSRSVPGAGCSTPRRSSR